MAKGAASTTVDISNADAPVRVFTTAEEGAKAAAAERSVARVTIESFISFVIVITLCCRG